jgi:hypothetical protein
MQLKASNSSVEIDDGMYDATLLSIEVTQPRPESPYQDPYFKWTFHVFDTDEGQELTANSAIKLTAKSKTRAWAEAILGRAFEPGEAWDNETFPPRDCQVLIKNDPVSGFAKIEDVLGVKRRQAPKRPVQQKEDDGVAM